MLLCEFSMTPIGQGESVSRFVARCVDIVDKSGLAYKLTPMGTIIEGEWDEVFGTIKKCFEALREDCNRISITIKVDYRKGRVGALESKIRSVEEKLGREVKKG